MDVVALGWAVQPRYSPLSATSSATAWPRSGNCVQPLPELDTRHARVGKGPLWIRREIRRDAYRPGYAPQMSTPRAASPADGVAAGGCVGMALR